MTDVFIQVAAICDNQFAKKRELKINEEDSIIWKQIGVYITL